MIDAAQVVADPGTITLDATNQASLAMNSAPTCHGRISNTMAIEP